MSGHSIYYVRVPRQLRPIPMNAARVSHCIPAEVVRDVEDSDKGVRGAIYSQNSMPQQRWRAVEYSTHEWSFVPCSSMRHALAFVYIWNLQDALDLADSADRFGGTVRSVSKRIHLCMNASIALEKLRTEAEQ